MCNAEIAGYLRQLAEIEKRREDERTWDLGVTADGKLRVRNRTPRRIEGVTVSGPTIGIFLPADVEAEGERVIAPPSIGQPFGQIRIEWRDYGESRSIRKGVVEGTDSPDPDQ
jgi:hypothetical protein